MIGRRQPAQVEVPDEWNRALGALPRLILLLTGLLLGFFPFDFLDGFDQRFGIFF